MDKIDSFWKILKNLKYLKLYRYAVLISSDIIWPGIQYDPRTL